MPRSGRTDLNRLALLDPARDVRSDPARTESALDAVHRRIRSETDSTASAPDTTTAAYPVHEIQKVAPVRGRRVRIALVAATAVVVAAGAVAVVVAVRSGTPTQPGADTPGELTPYTATIGVESGSGFRVADVTATVGSQVATIVGTADPNVMARVAITSAVSTPLTPTAGRDPVDLGNGVIAHWVMPHYGTTSGPPEPDPLAWDSSGFSVEAQGSEFGSDADVIAIAKAVTLDAAVPLKTPVAVTSLPAGWRLNGLTTTYADVPDTSSRSAMVSISVPGAAPSDSSPPAIDIDTRASDLYGDTGTGRAMDIGGRTWHWNTNSDTLTWFGPDRVVSVGPVGSSGPPTVSPATLQAFVSDLKLAASFQDTSTWFDAATALPS